MADILTQLQTCLDQLATQFYATIGYLSSYHDNSPAIPPANNPTSAPALCKIPRNSTAHPIPAGLPAGASSASPPPQAQTPGEPADPTLPPAPDSPRTFASRQRELARDLVIKEQQIEYLISVLPGIDSSEKQQEERIRELEKELQEVENRREEKRSELREEKRRLESVLGVVEWGVYGDRFGGV